MPGHFLVRFANRSDLFIDVFNKGALLSRADCAARMHELRPEIEFRSEYLAPVGPRQILSRMLNNLLGIYVQEAKFGKALAMAEMLVCLDADSVEWIRQRGLIQARLHNYGCAIADIERCLAARPKALDRDISHSTIGAASSTPRSRELEAPRLCWRHWVSVGSSVIGNPCLGKGGLQHREVWHD